MVFLELFQQFDFFLFFILLQLFPFQCKFQITTDLTSFNRVVDVGDYLMPSNQKSLTPALECIIAYTIVVY